MSLESRKPAAVVIDDEIRPPTEAEVRDGLNAFAEVVRAHYGARVKGVYLYGSRARGDHRPDSDADVAVVIADGDWSAGRETVVLGELSFEILLDFRTNVQGWPIPEREFLDPELHSNPHLARAIRRDGREIAP